MWVQWLRFQRRLALPISAGVVLLAGAASAEVLTVCTAPDTALVQNSFFTAPAFSSPGLAGRPDHPNLPASHQIALARDADGYDIILNWSEDNQRSLRQAGAQIFGMELGSDLVHLIVSRNPESLEHFVFHLNAKEHGELLWSGEATPIDEARTFTSVCTPAL